jgi:hypothetical protein
MGFREVTSFKSSRVDYLLTVRISSLGIELNLSVDETDLLAGVSVDVSDLYELVCVVEDESFGICCS